MLMSITNDPILYIAKKTLRVADEKRNLNSSSVGRYWHPVPRDQTTSHKLKDIMFYIDEYEAAIRDLRQTWVILMD
jgi:hypothetical protein